MKKTFNAFILSIACLFAESIGAVEVRIGDLVSLHNLRENQISGFGLVVGLNGTGDRRSPFTEEALSNYLAQLGVDTKLKPRDTRNVAAVLVVANVPGWVKEGDRIDVTVSSIGDARSLEGGVLLQSPLKAGNGLVVAVASGNLNFSSGSEEKGRRTYSKKQSASNSSMIVNGAIIEKDINNRSITTDSESSSSVVKMTLNDPSYSTINLILEKLNENYLEDGFQAKILNSREVELTPPSGKSFTAFVTEIENLKVEPQTPAKVVINEKTGTVIMGGNLAMDEVAISKTGLKVEIASRNSNRYFWTESNQKSDSVFMVNKINDVKSLVKELNAMGATTTDIIAILQGLKKSGILHAEVIIQ